MGFQVVFKFNTWKAIGMDEIHIFGVSVWRLMSREEFPFFFFYHMPEQIVNTIK
jgi:hypothetical protein